QSFRWALGTHLFRWTHRRKPCFLTNPKFPPHRQSLASHRVYKAFHHSLSFMAPLDGPPWCLCQLSSLIVVIWSCLCQTSFPFLLLFAKKSGFFLRIGIRKTGARPVIDLF